MHVLITGASGFVGRLLAQRILEQGGLSPGQPALSRLTMVDLDFPELAYDQRVRQIRGSLADPSLLDEVLEGPSVDCVFHLASIPGGLAERNYTLGRKVNLDATIELLERLGAQSVPARFVFASTIAVYGSPMPELVTDETPMRPRMSYGAQKLIGEILVDDFSRRGLIDGYSLRLPGIVARPPQPSGLLSAFMSDMFWKLKYGQAFECPVSPQAVAWWMSVSCCVSNLLHAAQLPCVTFSKGRAFSLPVLRLTVEQVIEGLITRFGDDRRELVTYCPDEQLEAAFGRFPELQAHSAAALGFHHDGDLANLIEQALVG
jgi:nucleoside-diphosphate-sugar epimerase